eukprot:3713898-Prymnesium_polylepis.1
MGSEPTHNEPVQSRVRMRPLAPRALVRYVSRPAASTRRRVRTSGAGRGGCCWDNLREVTL